MVIVLNVLARILIWLFAKSLASMSLSSPLSPRVWIPSLSLEFNLEGELPLAVWRDVLSSA